MDDSIQQRIQIARRDAEALKDRIKRKKDELADTTCRFHRQAISAAVYTCYMVSAHKANLMII
jgi:hypothetical protein